MKRASLIVHTTAGGHNVVMLDSADEDEAMQVAAELARRTGRSVTVTENLALIETIAAATVH